MSVCPHCQLKVSTSDQAYPYCCLGCKFAHRLISSLDLQAFYELRDVKGVPIGESSEEQESFTWLEALIQNSHLQKENQVQLELSVQGIHCAACVWLIEKLFFKTKEAVSIVIDTSSSTIKMTARLGYPWKEYALTLLKLGYRLGPKNCLLDDTTDEHLLLRFGVCAGLSANSMMISAAFYFGLKPEDEPALAAVFGWAVWVMSAICTWLGGSYFIKKAWLALRAGIIHLDLPIALGIALGFVGSSWSFFALGQQSLYFDTLNIFVTLMLLGRILQYKIVQQNRRFILQDGGVDNLIFRRITDSNRVHFSSAKDIGKDELLLIVPGEIVPVESRLISKMATLSYSWMSGESDEQVVKEGEIIPEGAHNLGPSAIRVHTCAAFGHSSLGQLLSTARDISAATHYQPFIQSFSRYYVVAVLLIAAVGFLLWLPAGLQEAFDVTVAVLVVTCPCAVGLSIPIAVDIAMSRLKKRGIYVKHLDFLERCLSVKKIIFDKTGTLTLSELRLVNMGDIVNLSSVQKNILYQMCSRSNHPKSRAICSALEAVIGENPTFNEEVVIEEDVGQGLTCLFGGKIWSLKKADGGNLRDVVFLCDDEEIASFAFDEILRSGAWREINALKEAGFDIYVLSGDAKDRVSTVSQSLKLDNDHVFYGQSPTDKGVFLREIDRHDTLMVGDGINDAYAFKSAWCKGTPKIDRPTIPTLADFYSLGNNMIPFQYIFSVSRKLKSVVRRNVFYALSYNVAAVGFALLGYVTPVVAAVIMPLSSIAIISLTFWSFGNRHEAYLEEREA